MWNALPITDRLYGFQAEQGYLEPWVAIAQIADHAGTGTGYINSNCLELSARVFLPELESAEQYERLLDAIREFTCRKTAASGCSACTIYYSCKGIVDEHIKLPLPSIPYRGGRVSLEAEFVEQYQVNGRGEKVELA